MGRPSGVRYGVAAAPPLSGPPVGTSAAVGTGVSVGTAVSVGGGVRVAVGAGVLVGTLVGVVVSGTGVGKGGGGWLLMMILTTTSTTTRASSTPPPMNINRVVRSRGIRFPQLTRGGAGQPARLAGPTTSQ